jgi:hypothetical protein
MLLGLAAAGAGLAFYSDRFHRIRTPGGAEAVATLRDGGSALALGAGVILLWVFARRWLAEFRETRAVRLQARRAVLITPAPVMSRLERLEARCDAADAARQRLIAAFADELALEEDPEESAPGRLRLAARDGRRVDGEKDSA